MNNTIKNGKALVGHHLNTKCGFTTCPRYAHDIGANFFQIFLNSPHQYNAKRKSDDELVLFKIKLDSFNMKCVIHANYMLNFCNPCDTYKHQQAIKLLVADLNESVKCGAIGVVIHMGKSLKMSEEDALSNYVKGVKKSLRDSDNNSIIILETGAGQGTEICTSIDGLEKLFLKFTKNERKRLMFCIDTCHIFAAGYNIINKESVDKFCELVNSKLGWDNVACIHLNDSACPLNSKKDRHADIGKGCIGEEGLKLFVKECVKKNVPIVLETPCNDGFERSDQIKLVRSWADDKSEKT